MFAQNEPQGRMECFAISGFCPLFWARSHLPEGLSGSQLGSLSPGAGQTCCLNANAGLTLLTPARESCRSLCLFHVHAHSADRCVTQTVFRVSSRCPEDVVALQVVCRMQFGKWRHGVASSGRQQPPRAKGGPGCMNLGLRVNC